MKEYELSPDQQHAMECGYPPGDQGMASYYLDRKCLYEMGSKERSRMWRLVRRCLRRMKAAGLDF